MAFELIDPANLTPENDGQDYQPQPTRSLLRRDNSIIEEIPEVPSMAGVAGRSLLREAAPVAAFYGASKLAGARTAAIGTSVGRAGGAWAGARIGALAGALVPGLDATGISEGIGALLGGVIGYLAPGFLAAGETKKIQTEIADQYAPESAFGSKSEQADYAAHPVVSSLASMLLYGRPAPMSLVNAARTIASSEGRSALAGLAKAAQEPAGMEAWKKAVPTDIKDGIKNLYEVTAAGGLNSTLNMVNQVESGNYSFTDLAAAAAEGSLFSKPWFHAPHPELSSAIKNMNPQQVALWSRFAPKISFSNIEAKPAEDGNSFDIFHDGKKSGVMYLTPAAELAKLGEEHADISPTGYGFFLPSNHAANKTGLPEIHINSTLADSKDGVGQLFSNSVFAHEVTHFLEDAGVVSLKEMSSVVDSLGGDALRKKVQGDYDAFRLQSKIRQTNDPQAALDEHEKISGPDLERESFAKLVQKMHYDGTVPKNTIVTKFFDAARGLLGLPEARDKQLRDILSGKNFQPAEQTMPELAPAPQMVMASANEIGTFASSNLKEGTGLDDAVRQIREQPHFNLMDFTKKASAMLGLKAEHRSAIGDWSDGAEDSIYTFAPDGGIEKARLLAARQGLVGDQKGVIAFAWNPDGKSAVHRLDMPLSVSQSRSALTDAGINYRTIIPTENGSRVLVFDADQSLGDSVKNVAAKTGSTLESFVVDGEFIGGDTREQARKEYAKIIRAGLVGSGKAELTEGGVAGPGLWDNRPVAGQPGGEPPSSPEGVDAGKISSLQNRQPNLLIQTAADAYNQSNNLPPTVQHYIPLMEERARKIADAYQKLPKNDKSPETLRSYDALGREIQQQWDFAEKRMGITFEAWRQEGQPYKNSREMIADVRDNHHLYFFTGGEEHPLLNVKDEHGLTLNDKLRAVHDLFGHAAEDYQFGPRGEENAWVKHSQMFSPLAQRALTTETRGQNSWVNFGPHNYDANGNHLNIPPQDRPFAEQKVALLPPEFGDWRSLINVDQVDKKNYIAPNENQNSNAARASYPSRLGPQDLTNWGDRSREAEAVPVVGGNPRQRTLQGNPRELVPGERDGKVVISHWSRKDLHGDAVDPKYYGTGIVGEEGKRRAYKKFWLNRSYFGLEDYRKEAGLGRIRHNVEVDAAKLYDYKADPDSLHDGAIAAALKAGYKKTDKDAVVTAYELAIIKAGYLGYFNRDYDVVAMFGRVPVRKKSSVGLMYSVGDSFKKQREEMPVIEPPKILNWKKDAPEKIKMAAAQYVASIYGKTIRAADGNSIKVENPKWNSPRKLAEHLWSNNDSGEFNRYKATTIPLTQWTLENAQMRLFDPKLQTRAYVSRIGDNEWHVVFVDSHNRVDFQSDWNGNKAYLETQFGVNREPSRRDSFVVEWENGKGPESPAPPATVASTATSPVQPSPARTPNQPEVPQSAGTVSEAVPDARQQEGVKNVAPSQQVFASVPDRMAADDALAAEAAKTQRGIPESQMLESVRAIGAAGGHGMMTHQMEHIGDLAHRAQEAGGIGMDGFFQKVRSLERLLWPPKGWMGIEEELRNSLNNNAEYRALQKHPELMDGLESRHDSYEQLRKNFPDDIKQARAELERVYANELKKYIQAHREENKPVTELGRLGRLAAIDFGKQDFGSLKLVVHRILGILDEYKAAKTPEEAEKIRLRGIVPQKKVMASAPDQQAQVGGVEKIGQPRKTENIAEMVARIRTVLFDSKKPVSDESTSAAWQIIHEMTDPKNGIANAQLTSDAIGGGRIGLSLYYNELMYYALKAAAAGDDSLFRGLLDVSEDFIATTGGGRSTAGSILRGAAELVKHPTWATLKRVFTEEREAAAARKLGISREKFIALLDEVKNQKLNLDEIENVMKGGKANSGKTLDDVLEEGSAHTNEAKKILDQYERSQTEWLKPAGVVSKVRQIIKDAIGGRTAKYSDEAEFKNFVSSRFSELGVPENISRRLAQEVWLDKSARESAKTAKANEKAARQEQNNAEALLNRLEQEQTELQLPKKRNEVQSIAQSFLKQPAGDRDVSVNGLKKALMGVNVTEPTADFLARQLWDKKMTMDANERLRQQEIVNNMAQKEAENQLKKLQLRHAGVEWLTNPDKKQLVQQIIEDALKSESPVDAARLENAQATARRLVDAGVDQKTSEEIGIEVEDERRLRFFSKRTRAMEAAAGSLPVRSIIDEILAAPYNQQQSLAWRNEVAERAFMLRGLSREQAEAATRLFSEQFNKALAQARGKLIERVLGKGVPRTNLDLENLIRSGALADSSWIDHFAKASGWKKISPEQFKRLAELDEQLTKPDYSPEELASIREQQMHILLQIGQRDGAGRRAIGEAFTASLLSGVRTVTVQLSPLMMTLRDYPVMSLSDPKNMMNFAKAIFNAYRANLLTQMKYSFKKDAFGFHLNELEHGYNELKRVSDESDKILADKNSSPLAKGTALVKKLYSFQRFVFRTLNTLDQSQMAVAREWKLAYYSSIAFKEAGLKSSDIGNLIDGMEIFRQGRFDKWVAEGVPETEAQLRANNEVVKYVQEFVTDKTGSESLGRDVVRSAENDIYSMVGRIPGSEKEYAEGFLSKPFNFLMRKISEARSQDGLSNIFVTTMVGMVNIPFRTMRFFSDFTPYGLMRYGIYKYRMNTNRENYWKQSFGTALQVRARFRMALAGSITMALATAWGLKHFTSDDKAGEEDFGFYITGRGPDNKVLADAWAKRGFKQYSANFVFGGRIVSIPLTRAGEALMFPFIAAAGIDDASWRAKEAAALGRPINLPQAYIGSIIGEHLTMTGQAGIFQTIGQISQIHQSGGDFGLKASAKLASSAVSATVLPFKQMLASISDMALGQMDSSSIESLVANQFPVVGLPFQHQAVNRFGDPLYDRSWYGIIARTGVPIAFQVSKTPANETIYSTLVETGAAPPPIKRTVIEDKYGDLTDQQFGEFVRRSGANLKAAVASMLPQIQQLNPQDANALLGRLATSSDAKAAADMGLAAVKQQQPKQERSPELQAALAMTQPDLTPQAIRQQVQASGLAAPSAKPAPSVRSGRGSLLRGRGRRVRLNRAGHGRTSTALRGQSRQRSLLR